MSARRPLVAKYKPKPESPLAHNKRLKRWCLALARHVALLERTLVKHKISVPPMKLGRKKVN